MLEGKLQWTSIPSGENTPCVEETGDKSAELPGSEKTVECKPHWWEARALTTPTMLPF